MNISGGLFNPNGTPILDSSVNFKLELWDPAASCLLYSEQHLAVDLSSTKGAFSFQLGSGTSQVNNLEGGIASFDSKLFENAGATGAFTLCPLGVTLNPGDNRLIRVYYDIGSGFVAMTPDVPISSAPYAMIAETLQGKTPANFVMTNSNTALSQADVENVFTNTNYANLMALLNGTSSQYMMATPTSAVNFDSQRLINVAPPTLATDAANKNYVDTTLGGAVLDTTGTGSGVGNGLALVWNAVQNKWVAQALSGSVSSVGTGVGLLGGPITTSGTISVDVGTAANKILQLNALAQIPAVDAFLLTNLNAITGLVGDVTASGHGVVTSTIANNAVTLPKLNVTGVGGPGELIMSDSVAGTHLVYEACSVNQVLQWTAGGWACADVSAMLGNNGVAAGTYGSPTMVPQISVDLQGRVTALSNVNIAFPVVSVAGKTGAVTLNTSDISGLGTIANWDYGPTLVVSGTLINVDVGTSANQIVQMTGTGVLPAVDGSLLTNVNAVELQSRPVSAAAPAAGEVLGWNASTSQWQPIAAAVGSVTSVSAGPGLLGGPITTSGSLYVDTGTTANKILQLNGSAQIPAVDASLLVGVNASKIGTRTISTTAPGPGQFVGWNATSAQWEPMSGNIGTVTGVVSGAGLIAGTITGYGTLNVDVGNSANQIVQFTAGDQYPAVDGFQITNSNAQNIQGKAVSNVGPNPGQVLTYNNTTGKLDFETPNSGFVNSIVSGAGLVAGTITSSGTLNVDVGNGANQVVQFTAGDQYPAVDGSLISNVNAVKLQTRNVSAAAPIGGEVLAWNSATSQWEPTAGAVGSVTSVTAGPGLLGGPINSSGSLYVDTGTTANKILQLNGTAQIPAVDGYLVTNSNAQNIQGRVVSNVGPVGGQVLTYNASSGKWDAETPNTGFISSIVSGVGLVAGTITSNGTLNVDVGTTGNKILQLTGGKYPAVDGSLITNLNALNLSFPLLANPIGSAAAPAYSFNANVNTGLFSPANNMVAFATAGTERVRIDDNGNVGIGTTSPGNGSTGGSLAIGGTLPGFAYQNSLNVQGMGFFGSLVYLNGGLYMWNGAGAGIDWAGNGPGIHSDSVTGNSLALYTYGTERMRITGSGTVGIGTTSPQAGLDVNLTGTLASAIIVPRDSSANRPAGVNGMIRYNTDTNSIEAYANGSWQAMAGAGVGFLPLSGGTMTGAILQTNGNAATPSYSFSSSTSTGAFSPASNMWAVSTNGNERLRIDNNGNVGIGTATPGGTLDVEGGTGVTDGNSITLAAQSGAAGGHNGGNIIVLPGASTGAGQTGRMVVGSPSPNWFANVLFDVVGSASNPSSRIVSEQRGAGAGAGYPGFMAMNFMDTAASGEPQFIFQNARGTYAAPTAIQSGDSLGDLIFSGTYDTSGQPQAASSIVALADQNWTSSAAGSNLIFRTTPDGTASWQEQMRITSSGNIGIGTSAPQAGLDIATTGTLASAIIVPRDTSANRPATAVNGMIRYNTNTNNFEGYANGNWGYLAGGASMNFPLLANPVGTQAAPAYSFWANSNTGLFSPASNMVAFSTGGSERQRIDNNGNVGIGTSTPGNRLSVVAPAASGTDVTVAHFESSVTADGADIELINTSGTSIQANILMGTIGNPGEWAIGNDFAGNGGNDLYFQNRTAGGWQNPAIYIDGTDKVGIGTTTPQAGLDVATTGTLASAIIVPRDTSANRPSTAINGMIRYNTTSNTFEGYANGAWTGLGSTSSAGSVGNSGSIQVSNGAGAFLSNNNIVVDVTNGRIGIGTSSPAASLDVQGAANVNTSLTAWGGVLSSQGSAGVPGYRFGLNTDSGMFEPVSNMLGFSTAGTERLRIDNAGNVGIGTASPGALVDLVAPPTSEQALRITDVYQGYGFLLKNAVNSVASIQGNASGNDNGSISLLNGGVTGVNLIASGASYLNGGNVGIGTTTPQAGLDVATTGTLASAIIVPRDTSANRPVTAVNGMIRYNTNSNSFEGYANGGWGALASTSVNFPLLANPIGTALTPAYSFNGSANTGIFSPAANMVAVTSAGTERLRVDNFGNVGIGVTAPAANLDIHGGNVGTASVPLINLYDVESGTTGISVGNASFNQYPTPASNSAEIYINSNIWSATASNALNFTGGFYGTQSQFQHNGTGTVAASIGAEYGIINHSTGTISDATGAEFQVYNQSTGVISNAFGGYFGPVQASAAGNSYGVYVNQVTGGFPYDIYASDSGANNYFAGKVGIGTTTPQAALDVATTGTLASAIIVPRDTSAHRPSAPVNGMIRYNTTSNAFEGYVNGAWSSLAPTLSAAGTSGAIQVSNGSGAFVSNNNIMVDTANGRLGINNSSPNYSLDVFGAGFGGDLVRLQAFAGANTDIVFSNVNGGWAGTLGADNGDNNFKVAAGFGDIVFFTSANGGTWGTERMRIEQAAGNVGIGTSTPSQMLDVAGNIHASGRMVAGVSANSQALSSITVDFTNSSTVRATATAAACGTLNITNTSPGGTFTVTMLNATATCTTIQWNGSTTNVKLASGYTAGLTVNGVVYTFLDDGATLWMTYITY